MAKKVIVLNEATGTKFGFGERNVIVSDTMAIEDAQYIETTYPGVYCKVIDVPETAPAATPITDKTKTPKAA